MENLGFADKVSFYRIAEPRVSIGDVSFPAPVMNAPEHGTMYFVPETSEKHMYNYFKWINDSTDGRLLERGWIHLTKESAIEHAKALVKLSGGNV